MKQKKITVTHGCWIYSAMMDKEGIFEDTYSVENQGKLHECNEEEKEDVLDILRMAAYGMPYKGMKVEITEEIP